MKLSLHFSLSEFVTSDTAARMGIDNTPNDEIITHLIETAEMLERIRDALSNKAGQQVPITVTSGYRCLALNRQIGSKDNSDHVSGYAVDWKAPTFGTPFDVCKFLAPQVSTLAIGQLIHEFGRWIHTSPMAPEKPVNRIITIDRLGTHAGIQAIA